MALNRSKLANELSEKVGICKREADSLIDSFFGEIRAKLIYNETVKLSGFGSFILRDKKARPGRNPRTGEECLVTARRVVTFHPSPKLRNRVVKNLTK